jgi:hypothetical protein
VTNEEARHYLRDLGYLLRDLALDARLERDGAHDAADEDLRIGRLMAYHEVLALMRDQATAFGIALSDIGFDGFDPDNELL